jgi:hypothetical protein
LFSGWAQDGRPTMARPPRPPPSRVSDPPCVIPCSRTTAPPDPASPPVLIVPPGPLLLLHLAARQARPPFPLSFGQNSPNNCHYAVSRYSPPHPLICAQAHRRLLPRSPTPFVQATDNRSHSLRRNFAEAPPPSPFDGECCLSSPTPQKIVSPHHRLSPPMLQDLPRTTDDHRSVAAAPTAFTPCHHSVSPAAPPCCPAPSHWPRHEAEGCRPKVSPVAG